jgi:hypothetical protein
MTTCLLASPDCLGDLKPLAVVSDEEIKARFPDREFSMSVRAAKAMTDPRRWVRCGCVDKWLGSDQSCPACNATGIAHVCERHREAFVVASQRLVVRAGVRVGDQRGWAPLSLDNLAFLAEFGADA